MNNKIGIESLSISPIPGGLKPGAMAAGTTGWSPETGPPPVLGKEI